MLLCLHVTESSPTEVDSIHLVIQLKYKFALHKRDYYITCSYIICIPLEMS